MYTMLQEIHNMVMNAADLEKKVKEKCDHIKEEIDKIRREKAIHICEFMQEYKDSVILNGRIISCCPFKFHVGSNAFIWLGGNGIRVVFDSNSQSLEKVAEGEPPGGAAIKVIDAWNADKEEEFKEYFFTCMTELLNDFKASQLQILEDHEKWLKKVKGE